MTAVVMDASAVVELFTGSDPDPELRRHALIGRNSAPELLDLEAAHVVRRLVLRRTLSQNDGTARLRQIRDAPITRVSHRQLLDRIWELRDSITPYDAAYIALAERLHIPLLTCDVRLGRAHGHDAEVIVYPRS